MSSNPDLIVPQLLEKISEISQEITRHSDALMAENDALRAQIKYLKDEEKLQMLDQIVWSRTKAQHQAEANDCLKLKKETGDFIAQIIDRLSVSMENAPRFSVRSMLNELEHIRGKLIEKRIEFNVGDIDG